VETRVQALLTFVDDTPLGKVRPCDIHKLVHSLKLRKACGLNSILKEMLLAYSKKTTGTSYTFNHCLVLSHFPKPWKEEKVITLPKPCKDPKFPQNLCLISLLSTMGKLFENIILKIVQRHNEERGLLNASQFCFRAHHSMTLQCMRLMDVTLHFNNNMCMAAVFLDI
jgi:hypothetical protein